MSRRVDAGFLAGLVAEHRLDEDEAPRPRVDLAGPPARGVQAVTGRAGRAAAPVRLVHLGLGNFFRAHQAWYTEHARTAASGAMRRSPAGSPASPGRCKPRTGSTR